MCGPTRRDEGAWRIRCKENAARQGPRKTDLLPSVRTYLGAQGPAAVLRRRFAQWQPPQVEQLPVQAAEGSCTAMGSPPFMAVLMMASI